MSEVNKPKDDIKDVGGRPTKYTEEACEIAYEHLSKGYSLASVAGKLDICRDTIFEWAKVRAKFSDAVNKGRSNGMNLWEERLTSLALTNDGNAAATKFAMGNLYREDWNERTISQLVGKDDGPIETTQVPAADRLKEMLDGVKERS